MTKQIRLERYKPIEYYEKQLEKLDMQIGKCFVAFDRDNNLRNIWVVTEKRKDIVSDIVYGVQAIMVEKRGFSRTDRYINPEYIRMESYRNIVQVDRKRFDKLDKSIALINAQLNAYQGEFKKMIEE